MKLFQYAIIYRATESEKKDGIVDQILRPITDVLASSDKEVFMRAARQVPEDYLSKLDRVEVAVRPF